MPFALTANDKAEIKQIPLNELQESINTVADELEDLRDQDQDRPAYNLGERIREVSVWLEAYQDELNKRTRGKTTSGRARAPTAGGRQRGGLPMPLSYLKTEYTEPSASSGVNVLVAQPGLGRPVLNATGGKRRHVKRTRRSRFGHRRGGFFHPSAMGSFIRNAGRLVPIAAYSGYKLLNNKTRKHRK